MAPTVLAATGLPIARDFDGKPLEEFFTDAFLSAHPIRVVDTYETERRGSSEVIAGEVDEEVVARLRGLGYFEGI